ncbi:MAG: hypothetical protein RL570_50 [Actinomycetota bacterium]
MSQIPVSKFKLGKVAAVVAVTVAFGTVPIPSATAAENYSTTVNFLAKSFLNGKGLEGSTPGTVEYGFTLDAMMQLKAGGRTLVQQLPAVNYMLATRSQPLGTASNGYLYNKDATLSLNVGRAGKFLFTSEVVHVPNNSIRYDVFKKLAARINSQTGEISGVTSGAIDYAWVALGLNSYQEHTLANKVVQRMLTLQNTDGGFGEVDPKVSTPDSTGLALQAINLRQDFGTDAQDKKRAEAEKKAVAYLIATAVDKNHWNAYGEASVNSTAYAAMGLKAAGKKIATYSIWLKSQLAPKGGFLTSWSAGVGDKFATAQAIAPLLGKSYLDLLP